MKICVVGAGYVGLSLSILLSSKNEVVTYDIDKEKVDKINNHISPIEDKDIKDYLKETNLNLKTTCDYKIAFKNSKYKVIVKAFN